jgi:spore coat protein CotF
MKYSMTQDLYDHNQNGQYNYNNQNNEEYEVDFDP